jgi:autotransporter-like protein/Big-like domain-containing protein
MRINRSNRKQIFSNFHTVLGVIIAAASIFLSAAPQALAYQEIYTSSDAPFTFPTALGSPAQDFEIVITEDFTVESLKLDLGVFMGLVSKSDFTLISPAGTSIQLTAYSCRQIPVVFGQRNYVDETALTNASPDPVALPGTPASYTFEDGGAYLGGFFVNGAAERGACYDRWQNTVPDLPDWPSVAPGWGRTGAWAQLPTGVSYRPDTGAFSDFAGESAQGTWILRLREYGFSSSWLQGVTQIESISLTFGGTDVPPSFSQAFLPSSIEQGYATVATFDIDNSASGFEVTDLAFTNTLPTGMTVATPAVTSNTCGGTFAAVAGAGDLSLSGGTVAAGAGCTLEVSVTAIDQGDFTNTTGDLTSSAGNSGTSAATLTVTGADVPVFAMAFDPSSINHGETSTLIYSIDNSANLVEAIDLAQSNSLPTGMTVASSPNVSNSCGGTVTATAGADSISFSSGTVAAGSICTVEVDVTATADGANDNVSGGLTSSLGSSGVASARLTVNDVTNPTVIITPAVANFSDLTPFSVTIDFSEDVTGFVVGDIELGNGTADSFVAVSASQYTLNVTPSGGGNVTIDVAAGVANDTSANANPNEAAVQAVVTSNIVAVTQRVIRNFLATRMDTIVSNEPALHDRLSRNGSGGGGSPVGFAAGFEPGNVKVSFQTSLSALTAQSDDGPQNEPGTTDEVLALAGGSATADGQGLDDLAFDIWAKGTYAHVRNETRRADVGLLYLGADYRFSPDLVAGVLGQLDWIDEQDRAANTDASGFGWMVGPYAVARLSQNLILDGRAAVGTSSNDVTPLGTYQDGFDTTRFMVRGQLTGDFAFEEIVFNPFFQALYFEERQHSYTDSLGNYIPHQTLSLGRFTFGPKVSTNIETEMGASISPHLSLAGLYDFDQARQTNAQGLAVSSSRIRGRITGGVNIITNDGWHVSGEGFYDGIGVRTLESHGASLTLQLPF